MKFGVALGALNPHFHLDAALAAERLGYESVWLPEHLVFTRAMSSSPYPGEDHPPVPPDTPVYDAFAYLAFLAAKTERVRLGTHVFNIGLRHPVHDRARRADRRHPLGRSLRVRRRRVVVATRSGTPPASTSRHAAAASTKRSRSAGACGPRRPSRTTASSSRSTKSRSNRSRSSGRGRRSSWVVSPRAALRRAARLGDGWIGMGHTFETAAPQIETLRALLAEHGRDASRLPDRLRRSGRVARRRAALGGSRRHPVARLAVATFDGSARRPGGLRGTHPLTRPSTVAPQSASRRSGCDAKSRIEPRWRSATSTMPGCIE